jgi:hypothetical protein
MSADKSETEPKMSNHLSGVDIKFPGGDARLDLTDLFVFQAPDDPGKTVLIMDSNPFMTGSEFHPDAVYRINIDNDGDVQADVAFTFVFSQPQNGRQTATAYYATGSDARQPEPTGEILVKSTPVGFDASTQPVQAGPCRLFIGVRSEPFFADAEGTLHGHQYTGDDFFGGKNVLSVALEVPNELLGADPTISAWATLSVRKDGKLVQMDRDGHPSLEPFLTPNDLKEQFLADQPANDRDHYLEAWSGTLQEQGGYSPQEAEAAVLGVLPDVLRYDRSSPARYPNGRMPVDDVYDAMLTLLTGGKITSDGVGPHSDYLSDFPFLGPPNP